MGQLKASGKDVVHEDKNDEGNIVVINTCGFIGKAKEESVDTILDAVRAKKNGQVDQVFVTGCLSERYKEDLEKEIPDVDDYHMPKFKELKSLVYDYRDKKQEEIKNLNEMHNILKIEIENNQKNYEKIIDQTTNEISNFIDKTNSEKLS